MSSPPPLEELARELAAAEVAADHEAAYAVRARIAEAYPGAEAASAARYKMALHRLFHGRDLVAAAQLFEEAAAGGHAFWSAAARTSLGLCLVRMGRPQKGMLELRKVAHAEPPSEHKAVALGFLEMLHLEAGQAGEAARARGERIRLLEARVADEAAGPPGELAHHLHQLGLALRDHGEPQRARAAWRRALELGEANIGAEAFAELGRSLAEAR